MKVHSVKIIIDTLIKKGLLIGVNFWSWGYRDLQDFALRVVGVAGVGYRGGRETLLGLYQLFKRNRIICPELSCKWQICLDKGKIWSRLNDLKEVIFA